MRREYSSAADGIVQTLAVLAIVAGVTSILRAQTPKASAEDDAATQALKHLDKIHNEQTRLDSSALLSIATSLVAAGGFAPIIGTFVWFTQHQKQPVEAMFALAASLVMALTAVSFAAWFKHRARFLLTRLKAVD